MFESGKPHIVMKTDMSFNINRTTTIIWILKKFKIMNYCPSHV